MFWPLPLYAIIVIGSALLIAGLFFMGPALAAHSMGRSLFGVIENSLGSIPAYGLRPCSVVFLGLWIAQMLAVPGFWALGFIIRREASSTVSAIILAVLLAFLFATGLLRLRTEAKLAFFTSKLAIAMLVAALLRVHEGWPAVPFGFPIFGDPQSFPDLWTGVSKLTLQVAPLVLLAANFGNRIRGRKQVAMTALMGIVLPLACALLVVGMIEVAVGHSHYYRPSLNPNVLMALFGGAADSAMQPRVMLVVMTMFGAIRFGARATVESISIPLFKGNRQWLLLGCTVFAIIWGALHQDLLNLWTAFERSATVLVVTCAVLTADYAGGRRQVEQIRRIDFVGVAALLAGLTVAFSGKWLLPSYGIAFITCLIGRAIEKRLQPRPATR